MKIDINKDGNEITTLRLKDNVRINVYPNVVDDNIPDTIQRTLKAGNNITIDDNTISCDVDTTKFLSIDNLGNDIEFGKNVTVDGQLKLNSKDDITFVTGNGLVDKSELQADYNTLDTKIEANTALIDTKQDKGNYALKSEIPDTSNLATKTELTTGLNGKQDKGNYALKSEIPDTSNLATKTELNSKQNTLVSGTNIKTINGSSLLGSGDISIEGGSGGDCYLHNISIDSNGSNSAGQSFLIQFTLTNSNSSPYTYYDIVTSIFSQVAIMGMPAIGYLETSGQVEAKLIINILFNTQGTSVRVTTFSGTALEGETIEIPRQMEFNDNVIKL